MNVKLTSASRGVILKRLLSHRFDAESAAIDAERHKLAKRFYDDVFSSSDRRKMKELPAGWLPEREHFDVEIGGKYVRLRLAETLRFTDKRARNVAKVYGATDPLAEAYQALLNRDSTHKEAYRKAHDEALSVLNSTTTVARLVEAWPEIAPFTDGIAKPLAHLPAINVATLNKSFGLPVKGNLVTA